MPVSSITEALDNLYVTTWKHMKKDLADNIFDSTPLYAMMRRNGQMVSQVGGRHIECSVMYGKNTRTGWITRGQTVPMNDEEFMTVATFDWRYLQAPLVRFGIDDQKNAGTPKMRDYVKDKIENAKMSLEDIIETQLHAGDGSAIDAIDGLDFLIPEDPSASITRYPGGINSSTYDWWRNQAINLDTSGNFATFGLAAMRRMFNLCGQNKKNDTPNLIICGQTIFEEYEDLVDEKYRIHDRMMGDLGFENLAFKGRPLTWTPSCPDIGDSGEGKIYFINTNYLKMYYDPRVFMDMTEWKPIPNQVNDRAAQIISAMSLTTNRRRVHGVIYNINSDA